MHVINNTLNTLTLVIGIALSLTMIGVSVWVAWHFLKVQAFRAQGEIMAQQERAIESLRKQIKNLSGMARMQEKRLNRSEIEAQRKDRLLFAARQEIEYFEDILSILLPLIARIAPDDKRRADNVMKKLGEFRRKSAREQTEWEETKDALSAYLDSGNPENETEEE